jgi:hypothetical protein
MKKQVETYLRAATNDNEHAGRFEQVKRLAHAEII